MKILHFIASIDRTDGGTTAYMSLLAKELKNKAELVIVVGNTVNPVDVEGVKLFFFSLNLWKILSLKQFFSTLLISEKPDLVHVNGIWTPQNWIFQREASRLGINVVLSPHGMLEPYIMKRNFWKKRIALLLYQNKALNNVDYFHATAMEEYKTIRNLGLLKNKDTAIIPNGIDISKVHVKENWKKRSDKFEILFLSRIHPKKGVKILIEAVNLLKKDNFIIYIAGEGEAIYIEELNALIMKYNLQDKIVFLGGVYGDDKWELFKKSDLFILPTYSENFGIVVLEALATGIPVLTTKGTPWEELIVNDCGWWIDLNIPKLKDTIEEILCLEVLDMKNMGDRGKVLVNKKYDIKVVVNKMMKFYSWIVSEDKKKPRFIQ